MTVPRYHASSSPQPWIEKYRPKSIEEVAAQTEVVSLLKRSIAQGNLPHLLFYGPPGTGKTSTILALARDMFGEHFRDRVLELNASDERGISVIREKVKSFARSVVSSHSMTGSSSLASSQSSTVNAPLATTCPPFKLIILDEADSMTYDAQAALRRTMETYSSSTRFCIICNYVHRIIEPLASRCAKFRFKPIALQDALDRVNFICAQEKVQVDASVLSSLIELTDGDLRKTINYLQSAHRLVNANAESSAMITKQIIYEMTGSVPNDMVSAFFKAATENFETMQQLVSTIISEGFSVTQFISQFQEALVAQSYLSNLKKSLLSVKLGHVLKCLLDGADGQLQLLDLGAFVYRVSHYSDKQPIEAYF